MHERPKVSVIVPAYHEEKLIGGVIRDIRRFEDVFDLEVIAIEGGSADRTAEVAREAGATVMQMPFKRGKGADFWTAALAAKGDYIIQIDADFQFQPCQLPRMVEMLQYEAEVVLGTRFRPGAECEPGSVHRLNLFGNWFLSVAVTCVVGQRITDTMAGYKGFRRSVLPLLQLHVPHFGYEAELVIRSIRAGFRVAEMPVIYKKRDVGISNVQRIRDGFRVLWSILYTRFSYLKAQVASCPLCTGVAIWDRPRSIKAFGIARCLWCGLLFRVEEKKSDTHVSPLESPVAELFRSGMRLERLLPKQGNVTIISTGLPEPILKDLTGGRAIQVRHLHLGAAEEMDLNQLASASQHLVACVEVLEYLTDPVQHIKTCLKTLVPGGMLVIVGTRGFRKGDRQYFSAQALYRLLNLAGISSQRVDMEKNGEGRLVASIGT